MCLPERRHDNAHKFSSLSLQVATDHHTAASVLALHELFPQLKRDSALELSVENKPSDSGSEHGQLEGHKTTTVANQTTKVCNREEGEK